MASQAPRYRHRSKSAPRGRSPDPKTLKKEVKSRKEKGKPATARDPYVTPPTKRTSRSVESSAESKIKAFRPTKLTFGRNSVHEIEAQHPRGKKPGEMALCEADDILNALKDPTTPPQKITTPQPCRTKACVAKT